MKKLFALFMILATSCAFADQVGPAHTVLRMPGSGTIAKFGAVDLSQSAATTNQLPVAKGGTGAATHTAKSVLVGQGTSAVTSIAPGSVRNVLKSDGTDWTSATAGPRSSVKVDTTATGSGAFGSTNTAVYIFTNSTTVGSAITYATSATAGNSFTLNEAGVYSATLYAVGSDSISDLPVWIALNPVTLTGGAGSQTAATLLCNGTTHSHTGVNRGYPTCSVTFIAAANDVVRFMGGFNPDIGNFLTGGRIVKVAD